MLLSLSCLYMKNWSKCIVLLCLLLYSSRIAAQTGFLTNLPPIERVQAQWQYCDKQLISDQDSAMTQHFLEAVAATADSLGDVQLKKYAMYFRLCSSLLFSYRYERYFPEGDYRSALAFLNRPRHGHMKKFILKLELLVSITSARFTSEPTSTARRLTAC